MHNQTDLLAAPDLTWHDRVEADVVVVGAGIAGLVFALRLSQSLRTIIVTKGSLGESNTRYAQGGLAAAIGRDDSPEFHLADTIAAGAGLCDEDAVRVLVEGGPTAVRWLLERGATFDLDDRTLALGREAAHSRHRVLHAGGDATGAEIERALVTQIRSRERVSILEHTAAIDLAVSEDGVCDGVIVRSDGARTRTLLAGTTTVLANGGAGQLWAVTSNPAGATGDGIAMAIRAGVDVADLEFTQFHPTVLAQPGTEPFLISEAVRGEGAYLRSSTGDRFMVAEHPAAELAPRDVVARAIQRQLAREGGQPVFLDLRHLDPAMIRERFPTITNRLGGSGLDLSTDLIPVAPAAHYFMGGIVARVDGTTSLPGLLALGEVSCTGIHGANRLASNSLLEGLVFGLRAADRINDKAHTPKANSLADHHARTGDLDVANRQDLIARDTRARIQELMSAHVAVVRDARSLDHAQSELEALGQIVAVLQPTWQFSELRNMLLLSQEVTKSALAREESRGGHFREDFPALDPDLDHQHQIVRRRGTSGMVRTFGALDQTPQFTHGRS